MAGRADPRYAIPYAHPLEIKRAHLLERLKAARDRRLVLAVAPAGYGKSTLVAQFARTTSRAVAWVNLSSEDSEALLLGRSVAQAVHTALPNVDLTRWERAASLDAGSEQLATALAADLNLLSGDLIIVLETLEHLSEESGRWLTAFLQRLGEGHQLIATFWDWGGEVAVDFSRFVADGQTLVINQDDLSFTLEEAEKFFLQANSELDAREVWEAVEGWPAALGMVLHGAPLHGTPQDLIRGILRNLPEATRNALQEAAVLDIWSREGAVQLGLNLPPLWLHDAQRSGLPIQLLGSGRYQPHKVLLSTLEEVLQEQPVRHAELHVKAARLAETNGDLITAVNHYRIAARFDQARRVLDHLLPRYHRRSEWMLIRKLLEPFPLHTLSPYAATMLGTAFIETRAIDAGGRILKEQLARGEASGATYFGLALTPFRQGAFQQVLDLADAGLAITTHQRDATELLRVKAAALALSNRKEEAIIVAQECVRRAERQGEPGLLAHALSVQQFVLSTSNRYEESLEVGRRAIDLALLRDAPKKAMPAVQSYANTLWILGRASEAYPIIEQTIARSEYDYPLAKPFMIYQRANVYEQLEQYERALQDYQEAGGLFLAFENKSTASTAFAECAAMLLCLDRTEEAETFLSRALGLVHQDDLPAQVTIRCVEGALYLSRNDVDRAREALEWGYRHAKQLKENFGAVIARGYLVEAARREGRLDRSHIAAFVHDLDTFGYDWVLRRYADEWVNFYRTCVENGWYAERFHPYLNPQKLNVPLPIKPRLELKLFGNFQARFGDTEVKLSTRPQEVLAYLALHGRTRIDVLADAIWPNATLLSAKRNLAQQVRALRETLAQASGSPISPLVTEDNSYGLSEDIEVRSDVEALERALNSTSTDEMLQAIRNYDGELLPHLHSEWVLQARRRYEQMAASLALVLARRLKPGSVQVAIELYNKVIQLNPYSQEAHDELATIYEETNNHAAALRIRMQWSELENDLRLS